MMKDETAATALPYIQLDEVGRVREIGFRGVELFERLRVHYHLPPLASLLAAPDRAWLDSEGQAAPPLKDDFSPAGHYLQPHLNPPRAFQVFHDLYYLIVVSLTPGHSLDIQPDRDELPNAETPADELSFLLRTRSAKDDFYWVLQESGLFGEDDLIEVILPGDARVTGDPDAPSRVHPVGHVRDLLSPFEDDLRAQQAAAIRAEEAALEAERLSDGLREMTEAAFEGMPASGPRATNPRDIMMSRVGTASVKRTA